MKGRICLSTEDKIQVVNELLFNSENSEVSSANHFYTELFFEFSHLCIDL